MRRTILIWAVVSALAMGALAQRPRRAFFTGRVIAAGQPRPNAFVQLEGLLDEHLSTVVTDADGGFSFDELTIDTDYVYIVVEEQGFKPYRERLDVPYVLGGMVAIYLVPEDTEEDSGADGPLVVNLRQLLVRIPEEASEAYEEAIEESEEGNHDGAVEHLERALALAPDFYEAWIKLGTEYAELDKYEDAEAAYYRAIEASPSGALAPLNLGALHYLQAERALLEENETTAGARLEQARASLVRAIELDPFSAEARFYLGAVLYRMGAYEESEQALLTSLEFDSLDAGGGQARLTLINVYTRLGRYDAALGQIDTFIEENPDSPQRLSLEQVRAQIEAALER